MIRLVQEIVSQKKRRFYLMLKLYNSFENILSVAFPIMIQVHCFLLDLCESKMHHFAKESKTFLFKGAIQRVKRSADFALTSDIIIDQLLIFLQVVKE